MYFESSCYNKLFVSLICFNNSPPPTPPNLFMCHKGGEFHYDYILPAFVNYYIVTVILTIVVLYNGDYST